MKTDLQLQRDVLGELQREPAIHAAGIGVEVQDGVVTLDGSVGTYPEKWEAEKAVERVAGVTAVAVAVDLAVQIPDPEVRDDVDLVLARETARTIFMKAMKVSTSDAHPVQTTFPLAQRPELPNLPWSSD